MERCIKSTASQGKKLMDQHVGTGFIIWKSSETTTTECEFFLKNGAPHNIHTGEPITFEFGGCGLMKAQS